MIQIYMERMEQYRRLTFGIQDTSSTAKYVELKVAFYYSLPVSFSSSSNVVFDE